MKSIMPRYVVNYFWGDDLNDLDTQKHSKYIIETILEKGDFDAVNWLIEEYGASVVKNIFPQLRLSNKSKNYWNMYFELHSNA